MIDPSALPALAPNGKTRIICPSCNGGSSREASLGVARDAFGKLSWHCFRATCGETGSVYWHGSADDVCEVAPAPLRPFTGAVEPLDQETIQWFASQYQVIPPFSYCREMDRLILPIVSPRGKVRGHVARVPWRKSPPDTRTKSLTYWNEFGPLLAWYPALGKNVRHDVVLAVEDQLSAYRASAYMGVRTVALLGTGVNQEKIGEIQRETPNLVIALDADATGQAFAMAKKWGQAFNICKVLVLDQDLKDMPLQDLTNLRL